MAEAYIIDAVRTPVGKRGGGLSRVHPADLGAHVIKALVRRTGVDPGSGSTASWILKIRALASWRRSRKRCSARTCSRLATWRCHSATAIAATIAARATHAIAISVLCRAAMRRST